MQGAVWVGILIQFDDAGTVYECTGRCWTTGTGAAKQPSVVVTHKPQATIWKVGQSYVPGGSLTGPENNWWCHEQWMYGYVTVEQQHITTLGYYIDTSPTASRVQAQGLPHTPLSYSVSK